VLGSERLTGALLDRLTHHASILAMNGDSYRLKQSAGRRRAAARTEQNQVNAAAPEAGEITQPYRLCWRHLVARLPIGGLATMHHAANERPPFPLPHWPVIRQALTTSAASNSDRFARGGAGIRCSRHITIFPLTFSNRYRPK